MKMSTSYAVFVLPIHGCLQVSALEKVRTLDCPYPTTTKSEWLRVECFLSYLDVPIVKIHYPDADNHSQMAELANTCLATIVFRPRSWTRSEMVLGYLKWVGSAVGFTSVAMDADREGDWTCEMATVPNPYKSTSWIRPSHDSVFVEHIGALKTSFHLRVPSTRNRAPTADSIINQLALLRQLEGDSFLFVYF